MIVLCGCFLAFAFFLWQFLRKDPRHVQYGDLLPGSKGYPVIGNFLELPKDSKSFLTFRKQLNDRFGDVNRVWAGRELIVFLNDPKDIEVVLKNPKEIKKGQFYDFIKSWLGTGLLTSTGQQWTSRRKALTHAFHFKILEQFTEVFNKESTALIKRLKQKQLPAEIDLMTEVRRTFISIICETAMGISTDTVSQDIKQYTEAIETLTGIITNRAISLIGRINFLWKFTKEHALEQEKLKIANGVALKIIKEKEESFKAESRSGVSETIDEDNALGIKKKTAFLEMLLKMKLDGDPAIQSYQDIIDETNTFFFAGHDTTSTATFFALEMLARHPAIQEELYKELKDNLYDAENLTPDELQNLPLLERVLKESIRLYPPAPMIQKQLVNDLQIPSGYTLPQDCSVSISIFHVHRHKDHWETPDEFNPDHFLPDVAAKRHPYAYIPFSAGPRNCIGQKFALLEFKIMIAKLVYNFKISLTKSDKGNTSLHVYPNIVLKTDQSPMLSLSLR